ncbi:uncharacterized protein [Spinacia oleracea]|uniref:rRNA N-glycosylase n=1 Tax=Spinacia oleracea TaxID=3562 RepID=A0ABM3R5J0_SPIOL|nr:uncharacterized protein LOC130466210 [Spinacia oleracea]XP_056690889.1 uncharacterized protein LOC130466210 [Spinacia oleracea]
MRVKLSQDDILPSESPTSDHSVFVTRFRRISKHPDRSTLDIPHLPLPSELSRRASLPNVEYRHDPESESEPEEEPRGRRVVGRGSGGRISRGRERDRFGGRLPSRGRNTICGNQDEASGLPLRMRLRGHVLVSMSRGKKSIEILYSRENVYVIAVRDSKNEWWEFSKTGDILFQGAKPLGFGESYTKMGNEPVLTHYHLNFVFEVFSDPAKSSIEDRKKAAQILIALTSESARIKLLANRFGSVLSDTSGKTEVDIGGDSRLLMRNWEEASKKIIDHCDTEEKTVKTCFKNLDFIDALERGGMFKIKDAFDVYGLLLSQLKIDVSNQHPQGSI